MIAPSRLFNKLYAYIFRYFWLPCPVCGEYFGGHEWGDGHSIQKNGADPWIRQGVCKKCGEALRTEIWMEGYRATGESSGATLIGHGMGKTFNEAVADYMYQYKGHGIEKNGRDRYIDDEAYKNRRSNWNIWACNLFDNEADARKAFG